MASLGVYPDSIAFGAALDAHRRAGNALGAVECLNSMSEYNVEPTAAHYNLVIRSLRAQVCVAGRLLLLNVTRCYKLYCYLSVVLLFTVSVCYGGLRAVICQRLLLVVIFLFKFVVG